jgi:hypothetical protein
MMISSHVSREAFVWIWPPEKTEPVVAGKLRADNGAGQFKKSNILVLDCWN